MDSEYTRRMKRFNDARFGMFIHWGAYAVPARGEWVKSTEKLNDVQYQKYIDAFHPAEFDARAWARYAKEAGMKYAVFTAKHHDGFCMFDSKLTDYKADRDYVREFLDAFHEEGLMAGLYYSLIDWHHPDYPHYGDRIHPQRDDSSWQGYPHAFERYLAYMHGQIRELCENYGPVDILWTDYSYDNMRCETWKGTELTEMVRSLQPDIILNNRLEASGEGYGSLIEEHPDPTSGDFVSPEQIIPPDGIRNVKGEPVSWEACVTMNENWGYCREDRYFKPASILIRKLVECVSKGGNLLLNVGPDEEGRFPDESVRILKEIGEWMKTNGESVYGCGYSGIPKPEYGRITAGKNVLYYHLYEGVIGGVPLNGINRDMIEEISLLKGNRTLQIRSDWITDNYPDIVFTDLGRDPILPDPVDTVIRVKLKP